jgi:Right handed beta helix region
MRSLAWALLVGAALAVTSGRAPSGRIIEVSTAAQLLDALHQPLNNVTLRLAPGTYELPATAQPDTVGVRLSGHGIRLTGTDVDNTIIVTHSALLSFKDCVDCAVDHLTIEVAGGYGVISVTNSSAQVTDCVVRAGIVGARASLLTLEHNEISICARGIELCDDAHAIIRSNLVEGPADTIPVPHLSAVQVGCDAQAIIERNRLRQTVYGILILDDANAVARFNVIEQVAYWGITCQSRKTRIRATVESNVVYQCVGSGIVIDVWPPTTSSKTLGRVSKNIVVRTGYYRHLTASGAIARLHVPGEFVIRDNTCYDNAPSTDALDHDVSREAFWRARRSWTRTYRNTPVGVDGRHKFYESAFLTRYGRWAD